MTYPIEFKNVSFSYSGSQTLALSEINLTIAPGEIVLITGPAGSGKTTLCSCINGLIPHFHEGQLSGEVTIGPFNTRKARVGGLASLVGMVFQDPESQLVTNSVLDEVAFGPENLGISREEINLRVQSALEATRLTGYEEREPHNLSGGEQQACVIAATYAMHPEIYVMDEPLANLDPAGRAYILNLVVQVARQRGKTLVIVEHALEETLPLVERIIIMDKGRIVRDGPTQEVLAQGDIPHVFKRPDVMRLANHYQLPDMPLTPGQFHQALRQKYSLHSLAHKTFQNGHVHDGEVVIEFKNVSFSYTQEKEALHDVNLSIKSGEMVAILGRNGSGKTTLVRHIIGLQQPSQGSVHVTGQDVAVTPTHILARDVGFCFQNPNHQIVFDLGKGQKQRLALASVLTLKPKILVIDEPTTGQDPEMIDEIFAIIKKLNELGTTILLITHRIDYAALFTKRAVVLQYGRISYDGPIRQLLLDHELMRSNSLDLPELTKLAVELSDLGVPGWAVGYDEMKSFLDQIVEVQHGN